MHHCRTVQYMQACHTVQYITHASMPYRGTVHYSCKHTIQYSTLLMQACHTVHYSCKHAIQYSTLLMQACHTVQYITHASMPYSTLLMQACHTVHYSCKHAIQYSTLLMQACHTVQSTLLMQACHIAWTAHYSYTHVSTHQTDFFSCKMNKPQFFGGYSYRRSPFGIKLPRYATRSEHISAYTGNKSAYTYTGNERTNTTEHNERK